MTENRNVWIDYLRSFLTVLVVAHHSTLAYTTFASFDKEVYINSTHPIVDMERWIGLDIFVSFNDIFFMSLMFLIGGLFLSKSIMKKGTINFLLDRIYRLFIPFLFLGTAFMLIAYFPAYYVSHNNLDLCAYIRDFFTVEGWPVGPPWFLWVLFFFNVLFVLVNPIVQKYKPEVNVLTNNFSRKPLLLFFVLVLFTWIAYVPIAHIVGAGTWIGWLPFDFQLSRFLLYFVYFMIGVLIGNTSFNEKLFSKSSLIVDKWWLWIMLSLGIFVSLVISSLYLSEMVMNNQIKEFHVLMISFALFVLSCVSSCLAFITVFRKFAVRNIKWWNSLSGNAYLIYLIHYIFVVWIQFFLMKYELPAFVKFAITFVFALALSWITSSLLRKIKVVKRYL